MDMVIAEQVQDAVNQQLVKTIFRGNTSSFSLSGACVRRNDHISEYLGVDLAKVTLSHRE